MSLKRKGSLRACASTQPPPALRRNYTVCGLLHDRSASERDGELAQLLGYKLLVVDAADGTVRECSESLAAALGLAPHQLCGERLADWLACADEEGCGDAPEALTRALQMRRPFAQRVALRAPRARPGAPTALEGELYMPLDDVRLGSASEVRLALLVEGGGGAGAAELELQRVATRLRLPEAVAPRLREALQGLQRTFVVTDPNLDDNPIVYASPSFCELTGYAKHELVGRNCRLLQGPGTDLSVIREVRRAVARGTPCTAELLNYKRDGTAFLNLLHFAPVRDPSGSIAYFVGVQADLTPLLPEERARAPGGALGGAHAGGSLAALAASAGALDSDSEDVAPPEAAAARPRAVPCAALAPEPARAQQGVMREAPPSVREARLSVDAALSQHLREVLTASVLMHTAG